MAVPEEATASIVKDTVAALTHAATYSYQHPAGIEPPPALQILPPDNVRLLGIDIDRDQLAFTDCWRLDQLLHLAADGKDPGFISHLLRRTGIDEGRGGGWSRTDIAQRLLEGLAPLLEKGYAGVSQTDNLDPEDNRDLEVYVVALRLAQTAIWLCEREPGNPEAHELLPHAAEAAFLTAALPLRLLDRTGQPIDEHARMIWGEHLHAANEEQISLASCRRDAQRMRTRWLELLFSMERHPSLLADNQQAIDARLVRVIRRNPVPLEARGLGRTQRLWHVFVADEPLVFTTPGGGQDPGGASRIDGNQADKSAPSYEVLRAFQGERQQLLDLTALHLLPRYLTDEAFGLLLGLREIAHCSKPTTCRSRAKAAAWSVASRFLHRVSMLAAAALLTVSGLVPLHALADLPLPVTAIVALWTTVGMLAMVWALLLVLVVTLGGREGSYLAMLRMPATSAFGLAILLQFNTEWLMLPSSPWVASLPLVFLFLAGFYLYIEAVNQGAEGGVALQRAGLLSVIGAGVALSVTFLAMSFVAPAFVGSSGTRVMTMSSTVENLWALLLASTASFVLGTFLQAIWDEAPVTSPLSRLRLR